MTDVFGIQTTNADRTNRVRCRLFPSAVVRIFAPMIAVRPASNRSIASRTCLSRIAALALNPSGYRRAGELGKDYQESRPYERKLMRASACAAFFCSRNRGDGNG